MAKIETTFIRPKELYTPETGETKVVYDGYQNNPHELVVEENLEGEVSKIVNDTFVPNEGGNVVFTDGSDVEHELITKSGLGKAQVIETTWQALKDLRDNSQLTAGSLYRITDYNCTTTQENTQSAGHQFDIVLLALSENKLAEEGWAMMHDNIYDVTFKNGVTKKCYLYKQLIGGVISGNAVLVDSLLGVEVADFSNEFTIDEENKTATTEWDSTELTTPNLTYNYFQNSNLSAWKVWYSLNNDKSRFAWAQKSKIMYKPNPFDDAFEVYVSNNTRIYDSKTYYACLEKTDNQDVNLYVLNKDVNVNTEFYTFGGPSGREKPYVAIGVTIEPEGTGVIYRLIDEFNNDIKYDFKNIQFKRTITNGQYDATNGTETWCYTLNLWYNSMCQDASIVGNTLPNDEGFVTGVYDNKFGYATAYDFFIEGVNTFAFALGNNVVLSFDDDGYYGLKSNTIGNSFNSNTIGNSFNSNTIGTYFYSNIIGNFFESNTIGNAFNGNIIGNSFNTNTIGNYVSDNTIRDNFSGNTIGNNFNNKTISDNTVYKNYGNNGVELATKE